jgi:hypothetical protein
VILQSDGPTEGHQHEAADNRHREDVDPRCEDGTIAKLFLAKPRPNTHQLDPTTALLLRPPRARRWIGEG